jgi:hypothetical protein
MQVLAEPSLPQAPVPDVPHAPLTGDLSVVVGALHDTYDDRFGATVVDSEIQQVADRFADARIRSFVPLFVRRYASARLRDHDGQPVVSGDDEIGPARQ